MSRTSLDLSFSLKDQIVKAGAGAGKTYNLVECVYQAYKHFVEAKKKSPRFVVTTFTRKATHELRERMVLKACQTEDQDFFDFVTDPSRLHISTIHGVLTQFLREFGHLHDLDISVKVLEPNEESELVLSCVRRMILEHPDSAEWLDLFTISQLGNILNRFSLEYSKSEQLLPVDFDDLLEHAKLYFQKVIVNLREVALQGLETVEDEAYSMYLGELVGLLGEVHMEQALSLEIPSPPRKTKRESFPVEYHEQLQKQIAATKKELSSHIWDEEKLQFLQERWTQFFEFGVQFANILMEEKKLRGQMTMADLEAISNQILGKSDFLGKIFSEAYDFWLIDEFQDTSGLQLNILNQLIGSRPRFVVGDPQQSIYLFRGAQSELFQQEMDRVRRDGGRVAFLETNYRSQVRLLEFFNQLMSHSPQFSPMSSALEGSGKDPVAVFMAGVHLEDELNGLAQRILELSQNGKKYDGICVLGRTHDDLFKVASFLKSLNIPTHVHSPSGFWNRHEIKDALSLLRFLLNPHDNLNLLQILRSPWLKISDQTLMDWMSAKKAVSNFSLWNKIKTRLDLKPVELLFRSQRLASEVGVSAALMALMEGSFFMEWNLVHDPAGRVEANIWKLISRIKDLERRPGSNLFEVFDGQGEESDAVAATEPNCVNLMTIHGSKGLEFDHVFIPRVGREFKFSKREAISFSEDGTQFAFSLKDSDGEFETSPMERDWINHSRKKESLEVERWLYVAITRAKKTLTLSWNQDELKENSWVNRFKLTQVESESLEFRHGPFEPPKALLFQNLKVSVRPLFLDMSSVPVRRRESFTQIKTQDEIQFSRPRILGQFRSQAKGIGWHRRFEALKYAGEDRGISGENHYINSRELQFLRGLKTPPFMEILKNGYAEWGFQSKVGDRILEGQVDLWGYDSDKNLWVIDYKTGSTHSLESAKLQVEFYLWIIKRKETQAKNFKWAVIYPLDEKVYMGEASLEEFRKLEFKFGLA